MKVNPAICMALMLSAMPMSVEGQNIGIKTVALDAGHGGHDPGAVSKDRRTYEKTLTLDITKRLAEKISSQYPDIQVVQTRPRDEFVSLNDRAVIANRRNADLFISIHVNSSNSSSPNGYSLHVLGQSSNKNRDLFAYNMDVCRTENSVILLEDDYSTKYQDFDPTDPESFIFMQLMQNSNLEQSLDLAQIMADEMKSGPVKANRGVWQNPFYVLWKTSMPAVLVETGFISNSSDLQTLRDPDNRDKIASALFEAFRKYKAKYDGETGDSPESKSETAAPAEELLYGTQIFALSARLPSDDARFLGYPARSVKVGNVYKYVIGLSGDKSEAKRMSEMIREKYPQAFTVEISGADVRIAKF